MPSIISLRITVLKLLNKAPRHGYKLSQEIEKAFGNSPSRGALNPTLSKLENEGLVESYGSVEHGRYKKIYSITKKGKEELEKSTKKIMNFFKQEKN